MYRLHPKALFAQQTLMSHGPRNLTRLENSGQQLPPAALSPCSAVFSQRLCHFLQQGEGEGVLSVGFVCICFSEALGEDFETEPLP